MSAAATGPARQPIASPAWPPPAVRGRQAKWMLHLPDALRFVDPILVYFSLRAAVWAHGLIFDKRYLALGLIGALICAIEFSSLGLYRSMRLGEDRVARLATAWSMCCASLLALGYFSKATALFSRIALGNWAWLTLALLALAHGSVRRTLSWAHRSGRIQQTAVVAPAGPLAQRVVKEAGEGSSWGVQFLGFFDDDDAAEMSGCPRLGRLRDLPDFVRSQGIMTVYLAQESQAPVSLSYLVDQMQGSSASLYIIPNIYCFDLLQAAFHSINGLPVLSVGSGPEDVVGGVIKRGLDIAVAGLLVLLLSPLLLATGLAIKLDSRGPVFFRQRRYGLGGQEIRVWKFRTMLTLEDGKSVVQAVRNDARVTRVGRWLRQYSLDELPQLFNVLDGSMSLVGPRPHSVVHNEFYRSRLRGYMLRHRVRPGITGLAQVSHCRGETDTLDKMQRRLDFDLDYMRRWSILLDVEVLLRTIPTIFRRGEAY